MIENIIPPQFAPLEGVQAGNEEELLSKDHVVGVALGYKWVDGRDTGEPALSVLVDTKLDLEMLPTDQRIPGTIGDARTDVVEVGILQAGATATDEALRAGLSGGNGLALEPSPQAPPSASVQALDAQALTARVRPAMGGFSVGHFNVTAGTIATGCYDASAFPGIPARYYVLSNNHVLANSNAANIGDAILQPGRVDGGNLPQDAIGRLARFVPIAFHGAGRVPLNFVDAAIADVPFQSASREIYYIGYPKPPVSVTVGDVVQKTGRTTNYTTGRVQSINATVDVNYGAGRIARFARQILTTSMSAGGDSGSLVLNFDNHAVGLLFAGSPTVTILSPTGFVQSLLGIRIG